MHRPPAGADLQLLSSGMHPCQRRLALEELLAQHLSLRQIRERTRKDAAVILAAGTDRARQLRQQFLASLGFELTGGQRAALADIDADLASGCPMMRLVQGDVGCGKTVVAAAAALLAVAAGAPGGDHGADGAAGRAAPGQLLPLVRPLGITVAWLSGSLGQKARTQTYAAIEDGTAEVIVGTHALFQENLRYQEPGARDRRRAAPLRRAPAPQADGQGRQPATAAS